MDFLNVYKFNFSRITTVGGENEMKEYYGFYLLYHDPSQAFQAFLIEQGKLFCKYLYQYSYWFLLNFLQ